jgi:hypothetical protein
MQCNASNFERYVLIGYRGALLSCLLQVNVYVTHNMLNVLVQIANKMGLKIYIVHVDPLLSNGSEISHYTTIVT